MSNVFFGYLDEFLRRPGEVMALVVADGQNSVGLGMGQGIDVRRRLVRVGVQAVAVGDKHPGVKGDAHALDGQRQHGLDILSFQNHLWRHLSLMEHLIRYGAHAVAFFY